MVNKLIVCLGNPGEAYKWNRHNVGFLIGDYLIDTFHLEKQGNKFKSKLYSGVVGENKVFLIKPQTYMNLSGEAVQVISAFYNISPQDILVIYDDFEIEFGKIRIRPDGSAGTHNGMKNIIQMLGSKGMPRIRVGVGPKPDDIETKNFVLTNVSKEQKSQIKAIAEMCIQSTELIFKKEIKEAMNQFNNKLVSSNF